MNWHRSTEVYKVGVGKMSPSFKSRNRRLFKENKQNKIDITKSKYLEIR